MGLKMKSEQLIKLVADIGGEEPNNNPMAGANIDPDAEKCPKCDKPMADCTCDKEDVGEALTIQKFSEDLADAIDEMQGVAGIGSEDGEEEQIAHGKIHVFQRAIGAPEFMVTVTVMKN